MDRLQAMESFVLAADRGSLSAAARALGRSPAAVTRAVAWLEARLSVELLRRTTRSLKLTEAGERHLAVARRVLAELAESETIEGRALETPRGVLTVTAPVRFGALHVRPIVDAFLALYPDVRVRLVLLDRVVNIIDEGIDAAVRIGHLPDSALVALTLGAVRRVVCASPDYLARCGRPAEPRALAAHRCIAFAPLTASDTWTFSAGPGGGRSKRVKVDPVLTVNTAEAAIGSAMAGVGLTSALSYQVASALREGKLVPVLTAFEPEPLPVHLVYPKGSTTAAKVRAFLDLASPRLREALRDGAVPRAGARGQASGAASRSSRSRKARKAATVGASRSPLR